MWTGRGTFPADRSSRCRWHLLRVLQDNTRMEIRTRVWVDAEVQGGKVYYWTRAHDQGERLGGLTLALYANLISDNIDFGCGLRNNDRLVDCCAEWFSLFVLCDTSMNSRLLIFQLPFLSILACTDDCMQCVLGCFYCLTIVLIVLLCVLLQGRKYFILWTELFQCKQLVCGAFVISLFDEAFQLLNANYCPKIKLLSVKCKFYG